MPLPPSPRSKSNPDNVPPGSLRSRTSSRNSESSTGSVGLAPNPPIMAHSRPRTPSPRSSATSYPLLRPPSPLVVDGVRPMHLPLPPRPNYDEILSHPDNDCTEFDARSPLLTLPLHTPSPQLSQTLSRATLRSASGHSQLSRKTPPHVMLHPSDGTARERLNSQSDVTDEPSNSSMLRYNDAITVTIRDRTSESVSAAMSLPTDYVEDRPNQPDNNSNEEDVQATFINYTRHHLGDVLARGYLPNCWEFGGPWCALILILVIPLGALYLQATCTLQSCPIGWQALWHWPTTVPLFSSEALAMFGGFVLLHHLVAHFDVDYRYWQLRRGTHAVNFAFNSGSMLCCFMLLIGIGETAYIEPMLRLHRSHMQMCVVAILYALVLALWCYATRDFVPITLTNEFGRSNRMLSDFFGGTDLHRRLWGFADVKLVHHRMAEHATFVLNAVVLMWNIGLYTNALATSEGLTYMEWDPEADAVSTTVAALMCVHSLVLVTNERLLLTSFELSEEGVGMQLLLRYALQPFAAAMMARQTFDVKVPDMPWWALAAMSTLFVAGLLMRCVADTIKNLYRTDPTREEFNDSYYKFAVSTSMHYHHLDMILFGGWGLVRHPNYVGEMLCTLSLCLPLCWRFTVQPLLLALFHCAYMIHRARRVEARMQMCYGEEYRTYCEHVRWKFVPFVY